VNRKEHPFAGEYRQATRLAATLLLDDVLTCVVDGTTDMSIALDKLPRGFRPRIGKDLRRWSVAFTVAGAKLTEARPRPPASVAEALAMHGILSFAANILADGPAFGLPTGLPRERVEDLQMRVEEALFEDQDFLLLHSGAMDGIGSEPEEPIGRMLGTVNLAYADWFRALPGQDTHPYFDDVPEGGQPEARP
jgi:hypothetical protein